MGIRAFWKYAAVVILCLSAHRLDLEGYLQNDASSLPQAQEAKNHTADPALNDNTRDQQIHSKGTPRIQPDEISAPADLPIGWSDIFSSALSVEVQSTDTAVNPRVYHLPNKTHVDPVPLQRVLAALPKDEQSGFLVGAAYNVTSKMVLQQNNNGIWTLTTMDAHGNSKRVGGDEFYITFTDTVGRIAIANIIDWNNGTYFFGLVAAPTTNPNATIQRRGTLQLVLEQSCGLGSFVPPKKQNWHASGAINQVYTIHNVSLASASSIQPFDAPNQDNPIDLSRFDRVVFLGDSLVGQMACAERPDCRCTTPFQPNTFHRPCRIQMGLSTHTVELFQEYARQDLLEAKQVAKGKYEDSSNKRGSNVGGDRQRRAKPRLAIVIGSGVWDVLSNETTLAEDWDDHIRACRRLVQHLQQSQRGVSIFWKSMTAMHNHRVVTNNTEDWFRIPRVYYMSNARARRLNELQKTLMKELGIPVLDVFEATYLAAHETKPGDGRHYRVEFNRMMNKWFYPNISNSQVDI